jgi:hypothetical protein
MMPNKALDPEDLFQMEDRRREARLRHVERAGCSGDTAMIGYCDQIAKLLEGVVHNSSINRTYSLQQMVEFGLAYRDLRIG